MKLDQCQRSHSLNICWINKYIYPFTALLHVLSHLLLMTTLLYEPRRYHGLPCKDEEIKVPGGYDLPKIINLRFYGAKNTTRPISQHSLVTDTYSACKEANLWANQECQVCRQLEWVTQLLFVDRDTVIPLLPAKLPWGEVWLSRPLFGHTGHLTGLKGAHSTTGRYGNPTPPLASAKKEEGRETGAFVKCLLWARHDEQEKTHLSLPLQITQRKRHCALL